MICLDDFILKSYILCSSLLHCHKSKKAKLAWLNYGLHFLSQNPKDGLPNICLGREKEKIHQKETVKKREKSLHGLQELWWRIFETTKN